MQMQNFRLSRSLLVVLLIFLGVQLSAAEVLSSTDGTTLDEGSVKVEIKLKKGEGAEADLLITFDALSKGLEHYHLYTPEADGGIPTAIAVEGLAARGKATTPAKTKVDEFGNKVYAENPITFTLPINLPKEDAQAKVIVSYLACSDTNQCRMAVMDRAIPIAVKGIGDAGVSDSGNQSTEPKTNDVAQKNAEKHAANAKATGINWVHVSTKAEVEKIISDAQASGQRVYLDFTGPSCINCQAMAKNVLIQDDVRDAWNSGIPVEINTDASSELAQWQLERFGTYTRPMHVRLDPEKTEAVWNTYFTSGNEALMTKYIAFLNGGEGDYTGSGDNWWQFIVLALFGGLFTLVMPCTYPMIPLTINFFNKQVDAGKRLLPLALSYAGGIVLSFTLLGVIVGVVLGKAITNISGDPWINLIIGVAFILLGLSLLGVFFLRLPSGVANLASQGQMGYVGALLMGLTFAITAFTCTAPFAGAVLAEGAQSGSVFRPAIGMLLYSSVIAVPFFFLSMSPQSLKKMPNAGAWMNEFKFVGGMVEIAAAFKFLAISDNAWDWGIIGRTTTLIIWAIICIVCSLYVIGLIRSKGDAPVKKRGVMRLVMCFLFAVMGVWLLWGLLGNGHLGIIESFFPRDAAPI